MNASLISVSIGVLVAAAICWTAESIHPANPLQRKFRKGFFLDLVYWFFTPLITRTMVRFASGILLIFLMLILGLQVDPINLQGFGPLSRQPEWLQVLEVLLISDFIGYWTHRMFHTGKLWKFHAIHHSSTEVDWLSAVRLHPVNDVVSRTLQILPVFLFGFSPLVLAAYVPFLSLYAILLHANVSWTFGPFRFFLTSPVFHRWHHTKQTEAVHKNFAGLFSCLDLIFGTYYMPKNELPSDFGISEEIPQTLWGQMFYPFHALRNS